jgi:hypothetical protein
MLLNELRGFWGKHAAQHLAVLPTVAASQIDICMLVFEVCGHCLIELVSGTSVASISANRCAVHHVGVGPGGWLVTL